MTLPPSALLKIGTAVPRIVFVDCFPSSSTRTPSSPVQISVWYAARREASFGVAEVADVTAAGFCASGQLPFVRRELVKATARHLTWRSLHVKASRKPGR